MEYIRYDRTFLWNNPNTIITMPIQTHLIVTYDPNTDKRVAIGLLTSEKGLDTIKLSDDQPISGNKDKAQLIRPLIPPLSVKAEDFEKHEKGTQYAQTPAIMPKLEDLKNKSLTTKPVPYNPTGVTTEKLKTIIELHSKILPPKTKKLSHWEMAKKEKKAKEKLEIVAKKKGGNDKETAHDKTTTV